MSSILNSDVISSSGSGLTNNQVILGNGGTLIKTDTLFTDNGTTLAYTGSGGFTSSKQNTNVFYCDQGITNGTWADLPTCIDALVTAGGGIAYFLTPAVGSAVSTNGTFTRPLNIGKGSSIVTPKSPVTLILGQGVRLGCNFTAANGSEWQNCLQFSDGSGVMGLAFGATTGTTSQVPIPTIQVVANSHVYDVTAPQDQTGQQQSMFMQGIMISIKDATALVANAVHHEIDMYSGTYTGNILLDGIRSVGILIDNGDKSTFTPASVSCTVGDCIVTMAASTTATPNATRVGGAVANTGFVGSAFVKIAACNGGTAATPANLIGTWAVTKLGSGLGTVADAQTAFHVTASPAPGTGTVTGCTYTIVNSAGSVPALLGVNTVINHHNIVVNGSSNTGARPLVISSNGTSSQTGQMNFSGTENYEAPDVNFPNIEINGNGNTGSFSQGVGQIAFPTEMHLEPGNSVTTPSPGIKIRDAKGIYFGTIDASGCSSCTTGNLLDINQTVSNTTGDITVDSISNNNWPITVNNPLDPVRPIIRPGNGVLGQSVHGYRFQGNNQNWPINPFHGQYDPLDITRFVIDEQFLNSVNSPASGACGGVYGWLTHIAGTGVAGTDRVNPTGNTPTTMGFCQMVTGATTGGFSGVALDNGGVTPITGITNNAGQPWEAIISLNPGATITAGTVRIRAGFASATNTSNIPTSGVYIRFDTDAGIADTNWFLCSDVAGVETCGSLGVAPIASTNAKFYLRSDGKGKIYGMVNNGTSWGAESSMCAAGCTITATLLSGSISLTPFAQIVTDGNVSYTLNLNRFKFVMYGVGY